MSRISAVLSASGSEILAADAPIGADGLQALRSIERKATSENTLRSYSAARRYWASWYAVRFGRRLALPVPPSVVLHFIIDHFAVATPGSDGPKYRLPPAAEQLLVDNGVKASRGPLKPATIEHRVAVFSHLHEMHRDDQGQPVDNPCRDAYVSKLLGLLRKVHVLSRTDAAGNKTDKDATSPAGQQIEQAAPKPRAETGRRKAMMVEDLNAMLAHLNTHSLRHTRDRAILLVGLYSGGRRRSELAEMHFEDLEHSGEGYLWKLRHSKTGESKVPKPIQGDPAKALRAWIERSRNTTGPVFRAIDVNGNLLDAPMSPQAVNYLVKNLAKRCNLPGLWGAHSLRAGFMTQVGRKGMSLAEAMQFSDHRSYQVASQYHRAGEIQNSPIVTMSDAVQQPDIQDEPTLRRRRRVSKT